MEYSALYKEYQKLKEVLSLKKQAIIKKNLEELSKLDKEIIEIAENIKKFDIEKLQNDFSKEEKEELKNLVKEVKSLEENNEILINYSLDVINKTLSGILNIILKDKSSYDSKGKSCTDESLSISSIVEEA